jgi:hypothetical protein
MTTIEKIEKGIITLAEFTEDQQSFIRGIVKLSFNEGQEQALHIHDVVSRRELLLDFAEYSENDKTSTAIDECVDNYLDSIKQ